jgi:hypothetical protein
MELKLIRREFSDKSTIGELFIEGKFFCFVLEDKDRGLNQEMDLLVIKMLKVLGKTCIPYGRYEIAITFSNKFQKQMPLLLHVPGYEGIRIHVGNSDIDTLGCLLVGKKKTKDKITESTLAFNELFVMLESYLKREKVFITIKKATENLITH